MSMKLRRSLLVAGVPLAAALPFASTALAARSSPPVTVRIEGASRTLLQTRTVTVHAHGWVRKGGAPAGACRPTRPQVRSAPAKGRTPMPSVVRAPRTVRTSTNGGRAKVTESRTAHRGTLRFRISGVVSGRATLVVSAPHEIRSAVHAIRIIR